MTDGSTGQREGNAEEQQYLDLMKHILNQGQLRQDRTGTGTRAVFAPPQMRFQLGATDGWFPVLTSKRVFFRGVVEELLWFLRGDTNAAHLQAKGVHIWDGNASRAYLDSIGLTDRAEGDLGPVYGFQWRHFGATYTHCHADYTGQGVDQLASLIDTIQRRPHDRRLILSAWNPVDLPLMALPPCHMFCQFFVGTPVTVDDKPTLSCLLYQRSCDVGLGVPFNIASYALLTRILAHVCDLRAGEFIYTLGDAHIYLNHVEALESQLSRTPRPFPRLRIGTAPGGGLQALEKLRFEDFELTDYHPHGKLSMTMSV